jgi:hypothetical protein
MENLNVEFEHSDEDLIVDAMIKIFADGVDEEASGLSELAEFDENIILTSLQSQSTLLKFNEGVIEILKDFFDREKERKYDLRKNANFNK